jgi:ATP-dependent Clp protease ATP-binding subunit ClpC
MDLKLPLLVSREGGRLYRCWLPHWPDVVREGISLSELRDDLALMVMERFDQEAPANAWRWQTAPHLLMRYVTVDTIARDREEGRAVPLKGRLGVLLEKWPDDDFWIATATRFPALTFPIADPADLEKAFVRRLSEQCLKRRITTLEPWHVERNEKLDLLEVDADAPTVLPRGPLRVKARKPPEKNAKDAQPETEEEREQRRARRRLSVQTLRQIGKNLTHQARDGELKRAFGREALVSGLLGTLEGREGAAIALVGPSGVGKTALIHELTRRLVERQSATKRRDLWRIDGNQFISGMSYVGQWEARARQLCEELVETGDILYVDDLATLVFAGRHSKGDTHAAQYLEPHIARGELTIIAECTSERFERVREEAPSFAALFDVVQVPAMTRAETLPVLLGAVRELEAEDSASTPRVSPDALEQVLEQSERFFAHQALPGRAVRLIHRVLAGPGTLDGPVRRYRPSDVLEAVKRETGLPDFVLGGAPPKTREQISADLSAQVAGQPEAIDAVADAVLSLQLSVQDPEKPLANYLFVGPTGVGKTETAKALARYLFGSAERLVRFDMSELATAGSVSRLLGEPNAPDGELITALRTQPFCVILLDEVEKAHPRVFDALLQLLGEGRFTDALGRTADGRNCVVVMTSNLGVREAASQAGFGRADVQGAAQHYISAARSFFRPELFNRLDRVVPFRSLDKAALRKVVEHALNDLLSRRGVRRGNVLVDVEPELLELLVEQAFDPRYGARPLKRLLEKRLAVPLAHHLLRRHATDLAVVELFKRGQELEMAVRVLSRATPLTFAEPEEWTLPRLTAAVKAAREDVDTLLERRGSAVLTDTLRTLGSRLDELLDGGLDADSYEEEETGPKRRDTRNWNAATHRVPSVRRGVHYQVNPEVLIQKTAPQLKLALEELELAADQLGAREDEGILLLEPVGPAPLSAIDGLVFGLPVQLLGGTVLKDAGPRRRAFTFKGPNVRAQLEPWRGYAQVYRRGDDGAPERCLVRIALLDGSLEKYDARAKQERDARRSGGLVAPESHPYLVLDQEGVGAPVKFVASGLEATNHLEHLAAWLRAQHG